jgi:glycosyltransferase involved in cell wall biosynthesis
MVAHQKVAVIIPALNEADNIGALVSQVYALAIAEWVVVADNGSSDNTAALAEAAGAHVVREARRGYGYACAAGTSAALEKGADILIYMDADGSSLPNEMTQLLQPLVDGKADLVLGSRILGAIASGAMPAHQRFGNWLSSCLMRRLYGLPVTDLGPYRAILASLFRRLDMQEMTYGWPTEMMVKSARQNACVVEVPVSWTIRRGGRSKVGGTLRGSILAAYHILRVTLRHALA